MDSLLWHRIGNLSTSSWWVDVSIRLTQHIIPQLPRTILRRLPQASRCSKSSHMCFTATFTAIFAYVFGWICWIFQCQRFLFIYSWNLINSGGNSDVAEIARRHILTRPRALKVGSPLRPALITKSPGSNRPIRWNRLIPSSYVSRMLMIPRPREVLMFHDVRWYFNLFTKFRCTWASEIWDGITSLLIKFANLLIPTRSRIIILRCHIMIVEEIDFVAHGKSCMCQSELWSIIFVIGWAWISWVRIRFFISIYNCFYEVFAACTEAMRLSSFLEARKSWIMCYALVWIEKWWFNIWVRRWPRLFRVSSGLETVSNPKTSRTAT